MGNSLKRPKKFFSLKKVTDVVGQTADVAGTDTLKGRIGKDTDANGANSLFGKLRNLNEYVQTNLTSARVALIDKIGYFPNASAHTSVAQAFDAVVTAINNVYNLVNRGTIKSYQSGIYNSTSAPDVTLTISAVNVNKCICEATNVTFATNAYASLDNSTTLRIKPGAGTSSDIRWKVIEFY